MGKDGAYDYVRQAGCIQFDPVDVCGKNAELTLQSRVKGFKKTMLQELLYTDRKLVDYADKELSIWPTEDWPYFSSYRNRSRELGDTFEGLEELKEQAIRYIKENGSVCSDTLPIEGEIFWHSSMHWSGNWHKKSQAARSVLEQLYTDGELIIHHKNGSRKYYDFAEKYLPVSVLHAENPCKDAEEFLRWRVLRRIGAVGLLWDKNSTAFLGINLNAEKRKKILADLSELGQVYPIMVEEMKTPFYYRSEDDSLMREILSNQADLKPRMSFIAPLDPLMYIEPLSWKKEAEGLETPWADALRGALAYMGELYTYEQIMGMNGACYRVCFTDVWDYSCTDAFVAYDYATPLYSAVGYDFRMVERLGKQERKAERQAIMEGIQRGRPVLAINLRVAPEWGVITGYTDNGNRGRESRMPYGDKRGTINTRKYNE